MALPNPPPGWGNDEITKFFDVARGNTYATFANLQPEFQKLIGIDKAYRKLVDNLNQTKDWFAAFFVLRAHSNFLAGARLAASGQLPETYAALRSCLENGLYAVYIAKHPESRETWLRRHDDEAHKKSMREEFQLRKLLEFLASVDRKEGEVARTLYDRAIDYGAHPNERALMQTLQMNKGAGQIEFKVVYLGGDNVQLRLGLKSAAQVGVSVLGMLKLIYKERFDLISLTNDLDLLRQGL